MKNLLSITFIAIAFNAYSQDTVYARQVIAKLCSNAFSGRGYVNKGDKKAADYIANEFKTFKLEKFNNTYFQKFKFPVNTFPKTVEILYNGILLKPGIDFIVDPGATAIEFEGTVQFVPFQELTNESLYDSKHRFYDAAVIDTFSKSSIEANISFRKFAGDVKKKFYIKLTNDKLTWSSSTSTKSPPGIIMLSSSFDRTKVATFKIKIKNTFHENYESQNVIGYIPGTQYPDSFVVLTAHYDHLGMMGKNAIFPGANDNASGIAMLLNLVKYYRDNPQPYSVAFIAFSGEESGLIGSLYYTKFPLFPLENIKFLINIDLMGNGADGIMTVNGMVYKNQYMLLKKINDENKYLPEVKARGKAQNSDHYYFSEAGVPCFFFYLMGNYPFYHDVNDKPSALPLTNFSSTFKLFTHFITDIQKTHYE